MEQFDRIRIHVTVGREQCPHLEIDRHHINVCPLLLLEPRHGPERVVHLAGILVYHDNRDQLLRIFRGRRFRFGMFDLFFPSQYCSNRQEAFI